MTPSSHKGESNKNISMLRQWLNEERITDPKKLVTNEEIEHWLNPKQPTDERGCPYKGCSAFHYWSCPIHGFGTHEHNVDEPCLWKPTEPKDTRDGEDWKHRFSVITNKWMHGQTDIFEVQAFIEKELSSVEKKAYARGRRDEAEVNGDVRRGAF